MLVVFLEGESGILVSFSISRALACPLLVEHISLSTYHVAAGAFSKYFFFWLCLQELARLYAVNFCKIHI